MPAQFPNSDPASATPQATPFDTILAQCRDLVCERLCQAMSGMLDQVDAALSALISETRDANTQKLYAQTRDKALAQRATIEKQFRARYLREFQQRSNRVKKIGDSFSDIDLSSLELELVGDEDLDESLKFNAMAAKLRQYCDEELIALDQRVGVLLGDASLQAEDNPFTPQAICDAYKDTCRQIDANVEVRMVMLRLFDDYVADEIRAVYKAVNALLVQNSILPKIRIQARKDTGKPPVRPPADAPKTAVPAEQKPADGEQDLFSILKSLRAGAQPAAAAGTGAGIATGAAGVPGMTGVPGVPGGVPTVLQGPELLGMLTRIQLGDPGAMPANLVPMVAPGVDPGLANVLHGLKASSVGAGMNQLDMLTLDIMSLVFDQLFDDPKIPVGVKGLIGRLQIPMLKVAIADKTFFSKKTHPARQLLDALGEMSLRLPADFNAANPLFGRMEVVLQEVIDGFEDKMEIFDVARGRLEALIAEEDRRVEQETKTAATRVEQKEKLALAKTVAQAEIKMRARVSEVPREVMEFLAQQWVQLLLIVHVTEGEDSEAWKTALETMDLLIWSVEPKDSAEERRDLVAVVPELLKGVAAGLRAASVDDAVRNSFFAELRKLHDKVLGKADADVEAVPQEQETDRADIDAKTEAGPVADISVEIAAPAEAVAAAQSASAAEPAATLPPDVSQAGNAAAAPAPVVQATGARDSETTAAPAAPSASAPPVAMEPAAEAVSLAALETAPASDTTPASPLDLELTPAPAATTPAAPAAEPAAVPGIDKTAEPVAKTEVIPDLDFAPVAAATTPPVPVAEGAPAPGNEKAAEPVAKTEVMPDLDFAPVAAATTPPVSAVEGAPASGNEKADEPVAKTEAIPDLDFAPAAAAATQSIAAAGIEKAAEPVAEKSGGEPDLDFVLPPAVQKSPASEAAFLPDLEFTPVTAAAPAAEPTPPQVAAPAFVLDLELPAPPAAPAPTPQPAGPPGLELSPAPVAEPGPASTPAAAPGAEFVSFPELNFTPAPAMPPPAAATAAPAPAPAAEPEFKLELKRVVTPAPAAKPAPAARPGAAAPMQPAAAPVAKPGAAPAARPPIAPDPVARSAAAPPTQRAGAPAPYPAAPPARQPAPAAATKAATSAAPPAQRPAVPAANPAAAPVRPPAAGTAPAARMPPPAAQRAAVPGAKPGVAPAAPRAAAPATPAARPTAAAGVRPPTRPIARPASMPPASARAQPPRAESKVSDSLDFTAPVTIENPFGGGKVEVEDLDFTTKPAAGTAGAKQATAAALPPGLAIGTWVGIRGKDEKEPRKSAKLSFISPLKTRYLFVDKQGKTTLDCTRADLARRFQIGEVIIMDKVPDVPLFDRITEGLVGKLGGKAAR